MADTTNTPLTGRAYGAVEQPSMSLRLLCRRPEIPPKLQQLWTITEIGTGSTMVRQEWRDVPVIFEGKRNG